MVFNTYITTVWLYCLLYSSIAIAQSVIAVGETGGDQTTIVLPQSATWVVGGTFQQSLQGTISQGGIDIWLQQYDTTAQLLQSYTMGGQRDDVLAAAANDATSNDFYTTGLFRDSFRLGNDTVLYQAIQAIFLTKHEANTRLRWAKKIAATNLLTVEDLQTDQQGNIYLTGSFVDTLAVDGVQLVADTGTAIFVLKLDNDGTAIWGARSAYATNATGVNLAIDERQKVYLVGEFSSYLSILGDTLLSGWVQPDLFLAALSANGSWLWQRQYTGTYTDEAASLVYHQQNLYLAGSFTGLLDLSSTVTLRANTRSYDGFLARLDTFGQVVWAEQTHATGDCQVTALAIQDSQLVAVGSFEGDWQWQQLHESANSKRAAFQLAMNLDGNQSTVQVWDGKGNDLALAIGINFQQKIVAGGSFQQDIAFGNVVRNASGFSDGFVYFQSPIVLPLAVGLRPLELLDLLVFPNPTSDWLTLQSEGEVLSWQLYTNNGSQILAGQTQLINLQDLPTGNYWLRVQTATQEGIFPIIKQ